MQSAPPSAARPPTFLGHVHAFRAFAIVSVVAVHAFAGWLFFIGPQAAAAPDLQIVSRLTETLFHDATIYFALISGLLYSKVLHARGGAAFARGKALNVLLPYLVMTTIFTGLDWSPQAGWSVGVPEAQPYLKAWLMNVVSGQAIFVFWYLPVLLALFGLTPWLHRAVSGNSRRAKAALGLALALPLVFSRTGTVVSLSSILFFAAPYCFGLWLGEGYEAKLAMLARWRAALLAVALVSSVPICGLIVPGDESPAAPFFSPLEGLFYVQKMAVALWVLLGLRALDDSLPPWVSRLADASFAIYFVHIPVLLCVVPWVLRQIPAGAGWPVHVGVMAALCAFTLAASLALVRILQTLLGRRSRWLVGA